MPTIDDMQQVRWNAINPNVPFNSAFGIAQFWLQHPELGSPLALETQLDDGSIAQPFANGVVVWSSESGATLA